MKQSEFEKIFKKYDKVTFSDNLSIQILKSFKPQLEYVESFHKQLGESYKHQKILEANISQYFLDSMTTQMNVINKTSQLFLEQNRLAISNISKNFQLAQESILSQSYKLANSFAKQILPQLNHFEDLSKHIMSTQQLVAKNFSDIIQSNMINVQSMIHNLNISPIIEQIKYIRDAQLEMKFGHNIVLSIDDIKRENDFDLVLDEVEKLLSEQIIKNNPSFVGSSFFQNLLFFLLSIIFMVYQGKIQEQNIINRISTSEERIVNEIKKISPKENLSLKRIYFIKTKLNVRNEPSSKSIIIDYLFPNNKVEFIKAELDWSYVEYFDFINGLPKYGWIYTKHLVALEAK